MHLRRRDFKHLQPVEVEGKEYPDFPTIGISYAKRVLQGLEPCGRKVKLACRRFLRMLDQARSGSAEFYFSPVHVIERCAFLETLVHNEEGMWEGTGVLTFVLEPHIIWEHCAIDGFRRSKNHERLVERAYIEEPRKNWKSGRAAGIAMHELVTSAGLAPQILIGAATEKQGDRIYKPVRLWVDGKPDGRGEHADALNEAAAELREQYVLETTNIEIRCHANGGWIQKVSSVGEREDGFNPKLVVLEELHSQDRDVYEVLRSAAGAKPDALMYMITTAGRMATGLAWDVRNEMIAILEGKRVDDTVFAAIYDVDEEDERSLKDAAIDPQRLIRLLMKANPMWDVSIDPDKILSAWREALQAPHMLAEFLRTRFNLWGRAARAIMRPESWAACENPDMRLDEFKEFDLHLGVDTSSRNDMTALGYVFEFPKQTGVKIPKIALFAEYWIPEICEAWDHPRLGPMYAGWALQQEMAPDRPFFHTTPGSLVDFSSLEDRIVELRGQGFRVKSVVVDDHQGNQLVVSLLNKRFRAGVFKKTPHNATAATDDLVSRIPGKLLLHDGNPILTWNFANVVAYRDTRGGIMPKKVDKDSDEKIDGFDAVMQANAARLGIVQFEEVRPNVYASRGLIGFTEG